MPFVQRLRRRSGSDDRGAVAIIIAVGLIGLIGFAAYVIDIGALYEERRDLQNGADAAAMGAALDCVESGICTATGAQPNAESIASANANDAQATVQESDIDFDVSAGTVTVTTRTLDAADGDGEINFVLAGVLGNTSSAVEAEATASWYAPSGDITTIPLTFGLCEFNIAVGAAPDDPAPTGNINWEADGTSFTTTIYFHTGEGQSNPPGQDPPLTPLQEECYGVAGSDADNSGDALPGGFGFLQQIAQGTCQAYIDSLGWVQAEPGNGVPNGCDPNPDWINLEVNIPLFEEVTFGAGGPCGSNKCYDVFGFVRFRITGFRFPGETYGSACGAPLTCIRGEFLEYVSLDNVGGGGGGGPNLGLVYVGLTG